MRSVPLRGATTCSERTPHRPAPLSNLRSGERIAKTRILLEIRIREIDQAHGLSARSWLERARIQIEYLGRRKQRESSPPDHAASDVVRRVVMARRDGPVSDPYRRGRVNAVCGESEVVLFAKPREIAIYKS